MYARAVGLALLLAACGGSGPPPPPDLLGEWVVDRNRLAQLYVVTSAPKGPERDRALARVHRDHADLQVVFSPTEAVLTTPSATRTVAYRLVGSQGPLVQLEGKHGARWVPTILKVENARLTWFDTDGEIELVLRREDPTASSAQSR